MKKILILSDNPKLSAFVINSIIPNSEHNCCFELFYSSINKSPSGMKELGAKELNIKSKDANFAKKYDVIFSLHCKQIFPDEIVKNTRCINVHPGLNPFNRGWYPQVFSIVNKLPAGATIHLMNEDIDAGDIIVQQKVQVTETDTSLDVYEKVQKVEMNLLADNFFKIIDGHFETYSPCEVGNYNSVNDFKRLCKIDLDHVGSFREHIDILRALSHGDFNNSYFEDVNGNKRYIKIKIF